MENIIRNRAFNGILKDLPAPQSGSQYTPHELATVILQVAWSLKPHVLRLIGQTGIEVEASDVQHILLDWSTEFLKTKLALDLADIATKCPATITNPQQFLVAYVNMILVDLPLATSQTSSPVTPHPPPTKSDLPSDTASMVSELDLNAVTPKTKRRQVLEMLGINKGDRKK